MARVTAVCVLCLAGCAQIFGIDNTSAPPDVALPPRGTLTIERLSIGASMQRNPFDTTGITSSYYIEDSADTSGLRRIPATVAGNVFSADLPDGVPASVETLVNDPNPYKRLIAFPNRDIKWSQGFYEHPSPEAAPPAGVLNVTLTLPTGYEAGQLIRIFAIGPWSYRDLGKELPAAGIGATAVGPVDVPYDMTSFASSVGPRALQKITSADRVVAIRYSGNDLTAAGDFATFDQTGGTDPISATLVAVTHASLAVAVDPSANATRLAQTTPSNPTLGLGWVVVASPPWRLANANGIQLNAGNATTTDTMVTAGFGNPFEGYDWKSLFVWNPSRSRTYTPPALMLPVTLYSGLQHYFAPGASNTVRKPR